MAPLGVKGAAIATSIGQIVNVVVLAVFLLRRKHRDRYRTHRPRAIDFSQIKDLIRIGTPGTFSLTAFSEEGYDK